MRHAGSSPSSMPDTASTFAGSAFAAPASTAAEAPLASQSAAELQAALDRAIKREDFFVAAELQAELRSDARLAELAEDADAARRAAEQAEEDAALRKATDAGMAFLLKPRDGKGTPVVDVEEADDDKTDTKAPLSPKIFRMKGIIAVENSDEKYILQAVNDLFECEPFEHATEGKWDLMEERISKIVIIGKHIDNVEIYDGFEKL